MTCGQRAAGRAERRAPDLPSFASPCEPMNRRTSRGAVRNLAALGVAVAALLSLACAIYLRQVKEARRYLAEGRYEEALEALEKHQKKGSLLYLMEKGLVLHYAGQYEESNQLLEEAELLMEDLYTKSLSAELASLLTSDRVLAYTGKDFEGVMLNYYKALNYLFLGLEDDALVECRRVDEKLQLYLDSRGGDHHYRTDAFMEALTGVIYEGAAETNDAFISYRQAEEGFARYGELYGIPAPYWLGEALLRTSHTLRFTDEFERYQAEYGDGSVEQGSGGGRIVFLFECGFIPHMEETTIELPIFGDDDPSDVATFAPVLAGRHGAVVAPRRKVDYWLKVALPRYADVPASGVRATLTCRGQEEPYVERAVKVQDLSALARRTLEADYHKVLLKSVARALAKYVASKGIEKKAGEAAGWIADIVGVATESADTRSWLTLPREIHMAVVRVPSGEYEADVEVLAPHGVRLAAVPLGVVRVEGGSHHYLRYRFFG